MALHALGRLAEDGLQRDAGKGKVHTGETDGHEHDHQMGPDWTPATKVRNSEMNRANGGKAASASRATMVSAAVMGAISTTPLDLVQVAGVVEVLDVTGHAEGERLGEAMEDAVQQTGGDTERTTDTQAQRDHADVIDGGVREAALDIVLA